MCLVGCDIYYGLVRRVDVDYFIDHHCIEQALGKVKEVREIEYKYEEGSKPLTITGLKKADQVHYYYYKTDQINGYIYLTTTYENKSEICQTYGSLHITPPQEHIDIIRPIMKKIEKSINETCGIHNIETIVQESCNGVKCE
jgi:hypothetical protein